jgi:hypothetical protein
MAMVYPIVAGISTANVNNNNGTDWDINSGTAEGNCSKRGRQCNKRQCENQLRRIKANEKRRWWH